MAYVYPTRCLLARCAAGFKPNVLYAVFAHMYEDIGQMGEDVRHVYADFVQKLPPALLQKGTAVWIGLRWSL